MCCGELQKLPHSGWDNAAADDFPTNRVEVAYKWYTAYISSLGGDQKSIFDQILSGMCRKAWSSDIWHAM
jgi:hypothetical protein